MNSSEKEKLRKRLRKLFEKVEPLNNLETGKSSESRKLKETYNQNTNAAKVGQKRENPIAIKSKDLNNDQQSQAKVPLKQKSTSKQNGFLKAENKQNVHKTECALKQEKQSKGMVQKNKNSSGIKTKEIHSSKQKSCPFDVEKPIQQKNKKMNKKSGVKTENKRRVNFVNQPEESVSNSNGHDDRKFNKQKKKKARKRVASTDGLANESISAKRQKFIPQIDKTFKGIAKANEKHETVRAPSLHDDDEDEYDVNGMIGYVRGGDFGSDSEDASTHEEIYSENKYKGNNAMRKYKKNSQTDLIEHDKIESSDSEEEYFQSDDDDQNFDDFYSDPYEEEEENYSDFDENDYEEEEDSYNYSTDDEDDYFDDYDNNMSYNFDDNDSDEDYELPEDVPEDLIIHKGTAIKRNLQPDDAVSFDKQNSESQIVELENQRCVKVIYQPKACEKEHLLRLTYDEKSLSALKVNKNETELNNAEDCPKLVPIKEDKEGFHVYNANEDVYGDEEPEQEGTKEYDYEYTDDVSLGSEYMEITSDDEDSLLSQDITTKYLIASHVIDSDIDDNIWKKSHSVEVIDATGCRYEYNSDKSSDQTSVSLNDDISQIPSIKLFDNVDLKTECSILSTAIIDRKIFHSNKTKHGAKSNETQKESPEETESALDERIIAKQKDEILDISQEKNETENDFILSPEVIKSTEQSLADYKTKFFNAFNSNAVIVLLKDPFYIYGTVRLTLLAGTVEVYGHPLVLNTEVEIFSPRGCSVIEISASNSNKNISKEDLKEILKSYGQHFALSDLNKIADLYDCEKDAVVLLKRNEGRKKLVQQFKKFMNENVFPNINNINASRSLYNSQYLLRCMINTSAEEQKCLRLPKQWQQLRITSKSRVMLTGGKGVGKSTLLRYLINRHLPQKILLIDLDIGQPEVFIPQTISCTIIKQPLLGPGFFLNLQPEIAYAVGHINIILCAHKYIAAVRNLVAHCKAQEEYKDMPWLINTMGYNKGFGLELISVIAKELSLTDLVQLQSTKDINNFDSILHPHVLGEVPRIFFSEQCDEEEIIKEKLNYFLHVWKSAVGPKSRYQKDWEMSPKDMRFVMFLARLSDALQGHADWLTDIKPFSASLNEIKIVNLTDNAPSATAEQLVKAVEANLVYLCHHEDDAQPLKCLGIGVVRAVDFNIQQLYLIAALPSIKLTDCNCLAIGEFPLPTSLFTNQGPRVKNIAPFVYNTVAANASKAIKQIYHRPPKFLSGKQKSLD